MFFEKFYESTAENRFPWGATVSNGRLEFHAILPFRPVRHPDNNRQNIDVISPEPKDSIAQFPHTPFPKANQPSCRSISSTYPPFSPSAQPWVALNRLRRREQDIIFHTRWWASCVDGGDILFSRARITQGLCPFLSPIDRVSVDQKKERKKRKKRLATLSIQRWSTDIAAIALLGDWYTRVEHAAWLMLPIDVNTLSSYLTLASCVKRWST